MDLRSSFEITFSIDRDILVVDVGFTVDCIAEVNTSGGLAGAELRLFESSFNFGSSTEDLLSSSFELLFDSLFIECLRLG